MSITYPTNEAHASNTGRRRKANDRGSKPIPLVRDTRTYSHAYPDKDTIRWHEQCAQRRAERQERHEENQELTIRDNKTKIMLASMFLCAGISLGVMTRIGEDLFSSVVYGAMIGVFVDLLGAITMTLLGMSAESSDWNDYLDDIDEDADGEENDFAGLGDAMVSPFVTKNPKDTPMTANFVPAERARRPKALFAQPQKDMREFIDALASDTDKHRDDIIV